MAKKVKKKDPTKYIVMVPVDPDQGLKIPPFRIIPLGPKLATSVSYDPSQTAGASALATLGTQTPQSDMDPDHGVD
jgi:hypothetical protein